jgi:hypothetical protein
LHECIHTQIHQGLHPDTPDTKYRVSGLKPGLSESFGTDGVQSFLNSSNTPIHPPLGILRSSQWGARKNCSNAHNYFPDRQA